MSLIKKWWKKRFKVKEAEEKVDILTDIDALVDFLQDVHEDAQSILPELKKLEELEKERLVLHNEKLLKINLETQVKILDVLLEKYEFFEDDVNINGIRLKNVCKVFLKNAEKAGLNRIVEEKEEDIKWKVRW